MIELKNIPKGLIKVDKPDHPFAYDGPDTLLSDKNGLLAIFYIRENERKNASKLLSRLTNAIIAYPPHTKMLLLYDHKSIVPDRLSEFGKYYFSDFIEIKDLRKSKALIRDKKNENVIKEIQNIQKKIFTIQSQVQTDNLSYIKKTKFLKKDIQRIPFLIEKAQKAKYFDKISQKEKTVRANIFEHNNQYFGNKKLTSSASDLIELQPYFEFVINSEFAVDNGVPYYQYISRKALNLNEVPVIKFDPLKPTRIASLFGWHIVNASDFEEIENRIIKYRK